MVCFLDQSVAERGSAVPVADPDELLELLREDPGFGIHRDQFLIPRRGVKAGNLGHYLDPLNIFRGELGFHFLEGQLIGDLVTAN